MRSLNLTVIGASSAIGSLLLRLLGDSKLPIELVRVCASRSSIGEKMEFRDSVLEVQSPDESAFRGLNLAFISVDSTVSKEITPLAIGQRAIVLDDSSVQRSEWIPKFPLLFQK